MNILTLPNRKRLIKTLMVMKLISFFIWLACFSASGSVLAQGITLNEKDASLLKVFKAIEKQSGYSFFYKNELLKNSKPISIRLAGATLNQALDECFKGQPFVYEVVDNTIIVTAKRQTDIQYKKPVRISGRVVDSTGVALPGATIRIKGNTLSYLTNKDGEFNIEVQVGEEIIVSFVGYNPFIFSAVENMPFLNITLHPATSTLNDVVVSTGYQDIPKERVTGSFVVVKKDIFNQQVTPDVLSRLEYVANGVSVYRNGTTRSSNLMVRGISTITGPTSPLIVVDNFPYEGDLANLNPNDVESVTILKDAAASSIWGTKAGNGVIVITTKKGKFNQPVKVEFNSNVTIGQKPNLNYLTTLNSTDFIDFERSLYSRGYYTSQISSNARPELSAVVQLLANASNGTISQAEADQRINSLKGLDYRDDLSKYIYKNAINHQYFLNLTGGAEKFNYLFSSGYDNQRNNLDAGYTKINLRTEGLFKPLKNVQISTGIVYTSSNNKTGKPSMESFQYTAPYQMLADATGSPLAVPQTYNQAFKDNVAKTGQLLDWNYYPLTDYQHQYTKTSLQDLVARFGIQYHFLRTLSFDIKYQHQRQVTKSDLLYDQQSYYTRNLINSYTQVSGNTVTRNIPLGGILNQTNSTMLANYIRGQLNFNKEWGKHAVSVLTGGEIRSVVNTSSTNRAYGYNPEILTTTAVNYLAQFPNYATSQSATIPYNNSLSKTNYRFVSFYANGSYIYDRKYAFTASLRRDGSNLFGANTNDKWTPLWSSGLSWDVAKEAFYNIGALPQLKLRATYGFSGNVDPSMSALTTISYTGTSTYTGSPYSQVTNFANPELRWEKVRTLNIGVDFQVKGNRINGSIDFYTKRSTDLYANVPVDYTVGIGNATIIKNAASISGKGLDVEINSLNIDGQFQWRSALNFNYYRDKVLQYYLLTNSGSYYVNGAMTPVEGYPVWSVLSYRWAGLDGNGNPQGYLNGQVSQAYSSITGSGTSVGNLVYSGPRFPVFYGALGNTFTYKNLSLTARVAYSFGNYFRRTSVNYYRMATQGVSNTDYQFRWQKQGDEQTTNVPSFVYPLQTARDDFYNSSETLVEKADVIRLQYININYSFPSSILSRLGIKSSQVYISANNVGILWRANKYGIDPDYVLTGSTLPPTRNVSLGLRANF